MRSLFYLAKSLLGVAGKHDRFVAMSDRSVVPELTGSAQHVLPALPRIAFARPRDPYQRWLLQNELRDADIERMRAAAPYLALRPTFSIIMPTYNSDERYLRFAIESVRAQVYPNWELCIADDASKLPH
ncbi:MAG: glycosyltransferase, partial [Candidatus Velthaea sp.]